MRAVVIAILGMMAASGAPAAPLALVVFQPGAEPELELRRSTAILYDKEGTKQFLGSRDFITQIGGPSLRIRAWNPVKSLVRISPRGQPEVWLACEAITTTGLACSDLQLSIGLDNELRVSTRKAPSPGASPTRGGIFPSLLPPVENARGLPLCPGDPRCPRLLQGTK